MPQQTHKLLKEILITPSTDKVSGQFIDSNTTQSSAAQCSGKCASGHCQTEFA